MGPGYGQPQVIFFSELDGAELLARLRDSGLAAYLAAHGYGVAVALYDFTQPLAEAVRLLNQRQVTVIAWLLLPPAKTSGSISRTIPRPLPAIIASATGCESMHCTSTPLV